MKTLRNLHIYIGLATCWFLFFICFFGTSAYFKDEINYYMQANLSKSIKNESHSNLEKTLDYALKTYDNYEFIGIKTPPYYSNLYEISYYNSSSSKGERKTNIAYFDEENFAKNKTLGSKFLVGMHYKLFPSQGVLKSIFEAFISILALGMFVLVVSGYFIWNKKFNYKFNSKNNFANLYNFHIVSGVFIGIFLAWLSISGIGLNYLKDIEKLFSSSKEVKVKNTPKSSELAQYDFDIKAILKASEDAKTRLNTNDLNIVLSKPNKSILITKHKNDTPFYDLNTKNSNILVYSATGEINEKLSEKSSLKSMNFFGFLNELFFNTHRVHFAPFILNLMLSICGVLACAFIYKSMLMSAAKRKENIKLKALAYSVLSSCVNATLVYFIVNKVLDNAEINRQMIEQNSFYIAFVLSFILAFVYANKTKILKLISVILFAVLLLCDAVFSNYTNVTICFNIIYLIAIFLLLRRLNASANS